MRRSPKRLLADRRGSFVLELALVGNFVFLVIALLLAGSIFLWARGVIQVAASQTARCVAISSSDCMNRETYARRIIDEWGASFILANVKVTDQTDQACNGAPGKFAVVTVTDPSNRLGTVLSALSTTTLSATACYPASK